MQQTINHGKTIKRATIEVAAKEIQYNSTTISFFFFFFGVL